MGLSRKVGHSTASVRGRGGGIVLAGRTGTYQIDLLPKIQINIILSDRNVEKTIETICKAARSGKAGDGMIFVYPVEDVIRIRTGERDGQALMYPDDIDERREKGGGNGHAPQVAEAQTSQV